MKILAVIGGTKNAGNLTALRDITFTIGEGEILGLIGPNGAGKTAPVNLIARVISYCTGDIFLVEKRLRAQASQDWEPGNQSNILGCVAHCQYDYTEECDGVGVLW